MDKSILCIITPENVELRFETVGIGSRMIAFLFDFIIQIIYYILFFIAVSWATEQGYISNSLSLALSIIMFFVLIFGYGLIFELIMRGKTPGKLIMGIRVIKQNGRPADFLAVIIRNLFRIVDFLPAFYGVGILLMFLMSPSRRLGDIVAGTVVVREYRKMKARDFISSLPPQTEANMTIRIPCLYPVTPDEFGIIKAYVQRASGLKPKYRWNLSAKLAYPLYEKFTIPAYERTNPDDFLFKLYEMNREG